MADFPEWARLYREPEQAPFPTHRVPVTGDALGILHTQGDVWLPCRFHSAHSRGHILTQSLIETPNALFYHPLGYGRSPGQWMFADEVQFARMCPTCHGHGILSEKAIARRAKESGLTPNLIDKRCTACKGLMLGFYDPFKGESQ